MPTHGIKVGAGALSVNESFSSDGYLTGCEVS